MSSLWDNGCALRNVGPEDHLWAKDSGVIRANGKKIHNAPIGVFLPFLVLLNRDQQKEKPWAGDDSRI